jgi:hypothetical protein
MRAVGGRPTIADPKRRALTPSETATRLGVTTDDLRSLRQHGGGPAFVTLTRKSVRYLRASVENWEPRESVGSETLSA